MNISGKLKKTSRKGATLVEMVVTMLIFSILMVMIVGILSPAAKVFLRMQRLQYAQLILDNTIQELRSMTQEAVGYVKIYDDCGPGANLAQEDGAGIGKDTGQGLEFLDEEGYVVLISTQGCEKTGIYLGSLKLGETEAVEDGRLLSRYYARQPDGETYLWKQGDEMTARAVSRAFGDGYYMENYLEIIFSYPESGGTPVQEGQPVPYLNAQVRLYSDKEKTRLVVQDSTVLDLRYIPVRRDKPTAKED